MCVTVDTLSCRDRAGVSACRLCKDASATFLPNDRFGRKPSSNALFSQVSPAPVVNPAENDDVIVGHRQTHFGGLLGCDVYHNRFTSSLSGNECISPWILFPRPHSRQGEASIESNIQHVVINVKIANLKCRRRPDILNNDIQWGASRNLWSEILGRGHGEPRAIGGLENLEGLLERVAGVAGHLSEVTFDSFNLGVNSISRAGEAISSGGVPVGSRCNLASSASLSIGRSDDLIDLLRSVSIVTSRLHKLGYRSQRNNRSEYDHPQFASPDSVKDILLAGLCWLVSLACFVGGFVCLIYRDISGPWKRINAFAPAAKIRCGVAFILCAVGFDWIAVTHWSTFLNI